MKPSHLTRLSSAVFLFSVLFILSSLSSASALTFALPQKPSNVVGRVQWTQSLPGDTFSKIGRRYDIGYYQLVEANPGIDPFNIPDGTIIVVPTRFILPNTKHRGIVVNLAELRIYYFPAHKNTVMTYPIGIGRTGWNTPLGPSSVVEKRVNPTWYVPASIREDRAKDGVNLPKQVLPGPDNPLGGYALRLAQRTYLIHGTNDYRGVGRRSSSGCIRMFSEDIEALFAQVAKNEPVMIVNEPYKIGWSENQVYLESHVPLQDQQGSKVFDEAEVKKIISSLKIEEHATVIDWETAQEVAKAQNGVPQVIGH